MKNSFCVLLACCAALGVVPLASGQVPFQNLDFEEGTFVPSPPFPPYSVSPGPALPGWTGYAGTNQVGWILHNTVSLGLASIWIHGPDYPAPNVMHGRYYVGLWGGVDPFDLGAWADAAIQQTGTVPAEAQSIRLRSTAQNSAALGVAFGGEVIPMFRLGTIPNPA